MAGVNPNKSLVSIGVGILLLVVVGMQFVKTVPGGTGRRCHVVW